MLDRHSTTEQQSHILILKTKQNPFDLFGIGFNRAGNGTWALVLARQQLISPAPCTLHAKTRSRYSARAGPKDLGYLPASGDCWDYRSAPLCPVGKSLYSAVKTAAKALRLHRWL